MNLLTQSSLSTYRRCPRQYYYRYELGLIREQTAKPLRFGSAYHLGLETRSIDQAVAQYDVTPAWADPFDWAVERETLRAMLAGYFWRYEIDASEIIATELSWELPLRRSRTFKLAGKIDKIIRLPDQRLAVLEYKTTSEDISEESDYWPRLRCDAQISAYYYAARNLGYDVQTVIYDVARKPAIAPKQIPVLDANGFKVVRDNFGQRVYTKAGKPRESASSEEGWTLETERETPEAFGQRLLDDIGQRPDFYYARREIPRLTSDLEEFESEAVMQSIQLRQSQNKNLWFRNVSAMTCRNCPYSAPCLQGVQCSRENVPSGFTITDDVHPELKKETV